MNRVRAGRDRATWVQPEQAPDRAELFNAVLGHELRTPLTAILAATQLLAETSTNEADQALIARVETNARRIERLAAELLDLARIRSGGGFRLEPTPSDLRVVLEECRASADVTIDSRGRTTGSWDPDRIMQVFANLVANALEHSPPGAAAAVVIDGDRDDELRVLVKNAATIPATVLPFLFQPFCHEPTKGKSCGLGLGLYIAREIVIAHGGAISVRSNAVEGTTVSVTLPRESQPR